MNIRAEVQKTKQPTAIGSSARHGFIQSRGVLLLGFFLTAVPHSGRALLSTQPFRSHQRFSLFSQSLVGSSGRTQHKEGFSSKLKTSPVRKPPARCKQR
jgi:hypothetical protein